MAGALTITTPTDREIVLTRTFAAPAALVFAAWTTPDLLRRWYGPREWQLVVCEIDLRPGGAWRYVTRHVDGAEMVQHGRYESVDPPRALVTSEVNDDCDAQAGSDTRATTDFVETGGGTVVTTTVRYATVQIRDAVVASGMEYGVAAAYEQLDELLVTTTSVGGGPA